MVRLQWDSSSQYQWNSPLLVMQSRNLPYFVNGSRRVVIIGISGWLVQGTERYNWTSELYRNYCFRWVLSKRKNLISVLYHHYLQGKLSWQISSWFLAMDWLILGQFINQEPIRCGWRARSHDTQHGWSYSKTTEQRTKEFLESKTRNHTYGW